MLPTWKGTMTKDSAPLTHAICKLTHFSHPGTDHRTAAVYTAEGVEHYKEIVLNSMYIVMVHMMLSLWSH